MKALLAVVLIGLVLAGCQPKVVLPDQSALDGVQAEDTTQEVLNENVSDIDIDLAIQAGDTQAVVESATTAEEQAELNQSLAELQDIESTMDPSQFDVDTTI